MSNTFPPSSPWTSEQLKGDSVSKKDLVVFLHTYASNDFLIGRKLHGKLANVVKAAKKESLIDAYESLFNEAAFRKDGDVSLADAVAAKAAATSTEDSASTATSSAIVEAKQPVDEGPPKYTKQMTSKGDKVNFPKKGDTVSIWYTGALTTGKVFDSNQTGPKKKQQPLKFKVGLGKAVRGMEEGIMTMSKGEKAKLTIEGDWAYGRKGLPAAGIGPNETLVFDIELISIE